MKKLLLFLPIFCVLSCKKLVQIDAPKDQMVSTDVYSSNASAAAVLTGIYHEISMNGYSSGRSGVSMLTGLSADELKDYTGDNTLTSYYQNDLTSQSDLPWSQYYYFIYSANAALANISASKAITEPVRSQLIGEAKFVRAFCNFYLVNLYGDIPLIQVPDYQLNAMASRTSITTVYQNIISDLISAQSLLSANYLSGDARTITADRVRPNKSAATALLARVYLYTADYMKAEEEASKLIGDAADFRLTGLDEVFLKNSQEAIWQLQPVLTGYNSLDAVTFVWNAGSPNYSTPVALTSHLTSAFEPGDRRFSQWIGQVVIQSNVYYYPYKYKNNNYSTDQPITENQMVMRLAEQYLIRSEARIQQGNISGGINDLNILRARARQTGTQFPNPLPPLSPSLSKKDALLAVAKERQTELFTEWGDRWLDLKRTGRINAVMEKIAAGKGANWFAYKALYPIPLTTLRADPNVVQNPGYN